jgi:hypothetical protein
VSDEKKTWSDLLEDISTIGRCFAPTSRTERDEKEGERNRQKRVILIGA